MPPVSSLLQRSTCPLTFRFFSRSGRPCQVKRMRVLGCLRQPQGAGGCRRSRHGCCQRHQQTFASQGGFGSKRVHHRPSNLALEAWSLGTHPGIDVLRKSLRVSLMRRSKRGDPSMRILAAALRSGGIARVQIVVTSNSHAD